MIDDDEPVDSQDQARSSYVADTIRKAMANGLSSLLMNEEGIRSSLGELPKDALNYFVAQSDRGRRELMRVVAEEFKSFLNSMDLTGELKKALLGMRVDISASVRFSEDEKSSVQVTHSRKKKANDAFSEDDVKTKEKTKAKAPRRPKSDSDTVDSTK